MTVHSEPLKDGKRIEQPARRLDASQVAAAAAMLVIGMRLWWAGAKYTLVGWVEAANWFLRWAELPARVPPPDGWYWLLAAPLGLVWQYIASGILGDAAFEGGMATALLGLFIHVIISLVIAGVFILGADRIPLLRRYAIAGSLLYGFGVFVVLNMIVTPLSAAPQLPAPAMPWLIEDIIEHIVLVGLPLGILVRRNASIMSLIPETTVSH